MITEYKIKTILDKIKEEINNISWDNSPKYEYAQDTGDLIEMVKGDIIDIIDNNFKEAIK